MKLTNNQKTLLGLSIVTVVGVILYNKYGKGGYSNIGGANCNITGLESQPSGSPICSRSQGCIDGGGNPNITGHGSGSLHYECIKGGMNIDSGSYLEIGVKKSRVSLRGSSGGCNCSDDGGTSWYHTDCPCAKGERQVSIR
jgi:hypothetical protein